MDYKDFTKGEVLTHPLPLKEFGNYGDKFSEDLGKLAFERPGELNALLDDMGDDGNYNAEADNKGAILTNTEAFYKPGMDTFNKAKKLICSYGMKDLIFVVRPRIHSMLITQIYSPSNNIGYVSFESMFGGVIITELKGKDMMYLHDKKAYQMAVAIDHPANGIYIDTHRYAMGLQNYLFK
ncbi:11199_t:CDS:2 [Ambispora gerdemannii]|uniref:11199_t:CDS:1 n=1 Tax=Ambispora gerdemannii TaxID=144530 RepID=A0A9N8W6F3_9GLOM|nr:11199_t:CDS:2 [Ambispora gerdemannii]